MPLSQPAQPRTPDVLAKSETTATLLSVGGSLVGPALIATALAEGNDYRDRCTRSSGR